MREIKFRFYDSKYKFMDTDVLCGEDGMYTSADKSYDTPNTEIQPLKDIIAMQYIGLKDKNDKEIYEGDIVFTTRTNGGRDIDRYGEVKYSAPKFGVSLFFSKEEMFCDFNLFESIEVVDNIYQNKEFLNETQQN